MLSRRDFTDATPSAIAASGSTLIGTATATQVAPVGSTRGQVDEDKMAWPAWSLFGAEGRDQAIGAVTTHNNPRRGGASFPCTPAA